MAEKMNNNEDMSVDELVSLLRDNISSADSADSEQNKTIGKKEDPDKDIASMLKKFIPEVSDEDFELDDSIPAEEADFELESDGDFEIEFAPDQDEDELVLEDDGVVFVEDDGEYDASEELEYEESTEEYYDDALEDDESFVDSEEETIIDALDFEEEELPKKKSFFGGLFGHGKKEEIVVDEFADALDSKMDEEPEEIFEEDAQDDISDVEMPELSEINGDEDEDQVSEEDVTEEEIPEFAVPQMFVFDNQQESAPEEEYFVSDKNPLAFDDDDDTPILPDESAFEDVGASDISEIVNEAAEYSSEEGFADEYSENDEEESVISADELGDKDIDLMIALGYEEELQKVIGKEKVDEISDNISAEIVDFIDIDNSYAFDGFEISSPDRFRAVGNSYKREHSMMKFRLLGTSVIALAIFVFELLTSVGVTLGGALNINHYPVVGIMLSLQLLIFASALSFRQILGGLYDAVTFNPSPNSIPAVAVLMTALYDLIMALIAPNSGLNLYNFPAALCLVFLVLGNYFDLSREIRAFNTIATRRPKYAASALKTSATDPESEMTEMFGSEELPTEAEKTIEVSKVGFIENYFRRTNVHPVKNSKYGLAIYPFVALAVALGILSFVTNRSGITAFNISILTVLFGMPMSAFFIMSYPFFSAVNAAFAKDATIIGEESVKEYSEADTVVFSDKEAFPVEATVTRGIKLYDNNAIYYVLYHLTSLYSKLGGPLKTRLEQATTEMGYSNDVQILGVYEKGVEAVVDGKVNVLAGQATFMYERGIDVGYDTDDEAMLNEGATAMYLVLDGVLSAKLYVSYNLDPDFEDVIATLGSEHMETVIRTCDPNIDNELLMSKIFSSQFTARVIKCKPEDNLDKEREGCGVVARDSITALAKAISLCNKIRRVRRSSKTVSVISMVVSVIMMVFLALFSSTLGAMSMYVALYQLFWILPTVIFTKLYVK